RRRLHVRREDAHHHF
uniref:Uncharacterized protein n=1 Tax=Latimeria chalumnae TaxID=7897 RepID=H3A8T0_LATCH